MKIKGWIYPEEYRKWMHYESTKLIVYKRSMNLEMRQMSFDNPVYTNMKDCGSWWVLER